MKFRTPYNSKDYPKNGEVNNEPSQTVPDQTMSIREIMARFVRGLPIGGAKVPLYEEDNDLPDLSRLDLAERQEYMEQFGDELMQIKKRNTPPPKTKVETVETKEEA